MNDKALVNQDFFRQLTIRELAKRTIKAESKEPTEKLIVNIIDLAETDASAAYCDLLEGDFNRMSLVPSSGRSLAEKMGE